jgi:hypothetical protein
MVMMFVGGVVLVLDGIRLLLLPWESNGSEVFCSSCRNPYSGKAVNSLTPKSVLAGTKNSH